MSQGITAVHVTHEAIGKIGKDSIVGNREILFRFQHPLRLLIGNPHQLRVGVFVDQAEMITHVKVIKINPGNFPDLAHEGCSVKTVSCPSY